MSLDGLRSGASDSVDLRTRQMLEAEKADLLKQQGKLELIAFAKRKKQDLWDARAALAYAEKTERTFTKAMHDVKETPGRYAELKVKKDSLPDIDRLSKEVVHAQAEAVKAGSVEAAETTLYVARAAFPIIQADVDSANVAFMYAQQAAANLDAAKKSVTVYQIILQDFEAANKAMDGLEALKSCLPGLKQDMEQARVAMKTVDVHQAETEWIIAKAKAHQEKVEVAQKQLNELAERVKRIETILHTLTPAKEAQTVNSLTARIQKVEEMLFEIAKAQNETPRK